MLVTLAVANRHGVRLVLDPFRPDEPVLSLVLPFYALPVRRAAGRHRDRRHRHVGDAGALAAHRPPAGAEAQRWQAEADRLSRERQAHLASTGRQLAPVQR